MKPTDDPTTMLSVRVPERLRRQIRVQCVRAGLFLQAFTEAALREKLARDAKNGRRKGAA